MILTIDNFDGAGARDYTSALDAEHPPRVIRKLNRPAEMRAWLVAARPESFVIPCDGARVILTIRPGGAPGAKGPAAKLFTGYLSAPPAYEYLGWGERGPVYRYVLVATSDESLLDRKTLPRRAAFTQRTAGGALKQLAEDLAPGAFDTTAVEDVTTIAWYASDPQKHWSEHARALALLGRAAYRAHDGALRFAPVGAVRHALDESEPEYSPERLQLAPAQRLVNDFTVIGRIEPRAFIKAYFLGDGFTLHYPLWEMPFTRQNRTVLDEEYKDAALSPLRWEVSDPTAAISVAAGKLLVAGGVGLGATTVRFVEQLELGGALVMQHGDMGFNAASDGIIGGLYSGGLAPANCVAGFRVTPFAAESQIAPLVNGSGAGAAITTVAGHRYSLTTRVYSTEIYRSRQTYHSSQHPAGAGRGGETLAADLRVVLEVHDIDPANLATLVAPSTVLYDGIVPATPACATYALINAAGMHGALAFTRIASATDAVVRSALPSLPYRTRLVGALAEGGECSVSTSGVYFLPPHVPAANEKIVVTYRGGGRAQARITDPASIAALARAGDDGRRGAVCDVAAPAPRSARDCEIAALALLDDATGPAWAGEYQCWSGMLPGGAADVFPGDALTVNVPGRGAQFTAIVREVELELADLGGERAQYAIRFANDAAAPLAFDFYAEPLRGPLEEVTATTTSGTSFLPELVGAEITYVYSTEVTLDMGADPPAGGGIEVRRSDASWGPDNDRNLVGRFTTRAFNVPRLASSQLYYLRPYDAAWTYSRYSTLLQMDWPYA